MDGPDEVGLGDRPPLVIGDRDQGHFAESDIERLEIGKVLSAVKSSHRAICHLGKKRKMKPVDATTRAVVDECVITRLEKATIVATIHDEPEFSELFMSYLLTRNSRIEEDLIDQLFNSSEKRLARLLLLLANFGKEGKPEPIVGKFSQETLAEMIGTTRSRVSFFMNKFRKLGFIEYNGKIEVHNSLLNVVLYDKPEIKTRDEAIGAE
jgi:CRP-like cAMP-binding protein